MPRRLPDTVPNLTSPTWTPSLTIHVKLVTPMAGHTATKADVPSVGARVREASVANALRNWWRICHHTCYSSSRDVFRAEEERFGSATKKGRVRVRTTTTNDGREERVGGAGQPWPQTWPRYALFPWESVVHPVFRVNMCFTVEVSAPDDLLDEIRTALAAWVHLGGVGQRTRRGMGSLRQASGDPLPTLHEILPAPSASHEASPAMMTSLPTRGNVLVKGAVNGPLEAWRKSVEAMWHFRQAPGFARDRPVRRRPGQSYYPEADSIRWWTGIHDHPVEIFYGFPRADLGLPIIVEIKAQGGVSVPPKSRIDLEGEGRTRFASPVITKAWWDSASGRYRPLIAILSAPHVWQGGDVVLRTVSGGPPPPRLVSRRELELTPAERDMVWMSTKPIREAFADRCRLLGFRPLEEAS